jgi:3-phytase
MKKECPKKTGGHALCVLNDKLYQFGGLKDWPQNDTSGQKDALVYDPATDTWDSLPDMLYARGGGSTACLHDGMIYVFGGLHFISGTESSIVGKAEMYDPGENTWTELADMPVPAAGHVNLVYKDKIYVFGGDSTFSPSKSICTNIIQEYDPSTDSWRRMQSMPFNRSNMMGQKVGHVAYLIGGYPYDSRDFPSVLSEVSKFDLDRLIEYLTATGINLDKDSLDLNVGETGVLVATVTPANAGDPSGSWASGNTAVATVVDGTVTGVAGGETYIYVTTSDGNFKDSCLVRVTAGIEVAIICAASPGGDLDDMCIWLHPDDPASSTIIASDKNLSKLFVYNLDGEELYSYSLPMKPGNIDIIYNFPLNGELIDVVGFNERATSNERFVFYRVDKQTGELSSLGAPLTTESWSNELYGFCLYRSPNNNEYYAFGCDESSMIQQYRLFADTAGNIAMEHKRTWQNGSMTNTEGMVADHEKGLLYAGNEEQGIYVYHADEDMTTDYIRFLPVKNDTLAADVEGLAIYYAANGKGYLLASSQGQGYFSVFERDGNNAFVRKFYVTGVGDTDGIDVLNVPLNAAFSSGIFACHNGNVSPYAVNLVKWDDIASNIAPGLLIDTTYWNPREAMLTDIGQIYYENKIDWFVYPNPADALINIQFEEVGKYTVEITSVNGQLLRSEKFEGPSHQIDLSSFEKGLFFITVRSRDYVRTEKIIKQ